MAVSKLEIRLKPAAEVVFQRIRCRAEGNTAIYFSGRDDRLPAFTRSAYFHGKRLRNIGRVHSARGGASLFFLAFDHSQQAKAS